MESKILISRGKEILLKAVTQATPAFVECLSSSPLYVDKIREDAELFFVGQKSKWEERI